MITARSTSTGESTLTIGKGRAAGIAVDDCVVDEYWNLWAWWRRWGELGHRAYPR